MKMSKKFDKLNDTFNVDADIVSTNPEEVISPIEPIEKLNTS